MTRTCKKCRVEKEMFEFPLDKQSIDGRRWTCRECTNRAKLEWEWRRDGKRPERPPCEFCGKPTSSKEFVCAKCEDEALVMFGERIDSCEKHLIAHRNEELKRIKDSLNCVCSVETRLRMKRQLAAMEAMGETHTTESANAFSISR